MGLALTGWGYEVGSYHSCLVNVAISCQGHDMRVSDPMVVAKNANLGSDGCGLCSKTLHNSLVIAYGPLWL